jgi:myxalamid-type polyketide synthase MxaC
VRLRADATYLVTGGLGGLGLQVARWLAQRGAGHLLLMGRRGLSTDAAVQAVAEIERQGTAVTVIAADVADEQAMTMLFARFGDDLPPLAGIVHTAADLSSAPVVDLDEERLQAMLRPKVQGTFNLHRLSAGLALDFFVLFSSTTALLGANGLAHYAAANVYLDSFAHYRRSLGLPALSINWGHVERDARGVERRAAARGRVWPGADAGRAGA